jgi:hypothetical protein
MNHDSSAIPDAPTDHFSAEQWTELTRPLRECEHFFRRLATEHGLELLGSSRWPEIRLRRRSPLLTHEVRLSLVEDEPGTREPEWVVRVVHYARFPPLMAKRRSVEEVSRFTDEVLRSDASQVEGSVSAALRRLL